VKLIGMRAQSQRGLLQCKFGAVVPEVERREEGWRRTIEDQLFVDEINGPILPPAKSIPRRAVQSRRLRLSLD
jgi:hypothetical protein